MDGMYSAIKGRRGGLLSDQEENAHQMPQEESAPEGGMDMKGLVQALSPDQKNQLLQLLVGGEKGGERSNVPAIEKGAMGPGEEAELEEESLGEGHESEDDIAEGMVASSDKMRSERGDQPRNLAERMKFDLAKKLKSKGK